MTVKNISASEISKKSSKLNKEINEENLADEGIAGC